MNHLRKIDPRNPLIYVGGAYRGKNIFKILWNINKARKVSLKLWQMGIPNICPHMNSALIDYFKVPDDLILPAYLEILSRCDVMILVDGWERSKGTLAEADLALRLGIPRHPFKNFPFDKYTFDKNVRY